MSLLLLIDTTTEMCSASVSENGLVLMEACEATGYSHGQLLTDFIATVLKRSNKTLDLLDAVAISDGPGSYTGLRIGASVAKGICYALAKPLIAVPTLEAMADFMVKKNQQQKGWYVPLIDARRMDAFYAIYDEKMIVVETSDFTTLDESFFNKLKIPCGGQVFLGGNGAKKIKPLHINGFGTIIDNVENRSSNLSSLADKLFHHQKFQSVNQYEPNYLKNFQGTIPRASIIH